MPGKTPIEKQYVREVVLDVMSKEEIVKRKGKVEGRRIGELCSVRNKEVNSV